MPDGLEKDMKPQDLADVFEHVRGASPVSPRKSFPGNKPEVVKPGDDGSLRMTAINAEIYGKSLVFEAQFSNLGWWAGEDDHAAWEVDVARAGKYAVWLDWACHAGNAGNRFQLQTPGGKLAGLVESTGTWESYRQARVGEVTLKAGRQRLIFRADGKITGGALIDLRGIRLVPLK